jgi:hypothetical protein
MRLEATLMSLGDRLGMAGLIVGLFGIAAFYLWPTKKWVGWISFRRSVDIGFAVGNP